MPQFIAYGSSHLYRIYKYLFNVNFSTRYKLRQGRSMISVPPLDTSTVPGTEKGAGKLTLRG